MIDFRSDTVTRPSDAMRQVMSQADVGDDVFGDDPTVNALEARVADLVGMKAGLLVPSGTQSNLLALLTHCGRGDEYIVGQNYHTYFYEAGGAACLGGIQPQPIEVSSDGSLDLLTVEKRIKPDDFHFAQTRLLALENTHSGKVLANSYLADARDLARQYGLAVHLDGARVFNAAVAQKISVKDITQGFDSVSVCFSKGLGAPIGSILCGTEEFIHKARRWRKMVGGGMRQSGIFAAAINYAIDNNVDRLVIDHNNAERLARELVSIDELTVEPANTNMLYVEYATEELGLAISQTLGQKGILMPSGKRPRLVTHLDIHEEDISRFMSELKSALISSR